MIFAARNWSPNRSALAASILVLAAFATPASADCGFDVGDWQAGRRVFQGTCIACHGRDGRGAVAGAPDFTQKGGALSKSHAVLAQHIENGFRSPGAPMAMPPKGGNPGLSAQDINNVHAYLHHQFGCGN